jgi:hypothetical protein
LTRGLRGSAVHSAKGQHHHGKRAYTEPKVSELLPHPAGLSPHLCLEDLNIRWEKAGGTRPRGYGRWSDPVQSTRTTPRSLSSWCASLWNPKDYRLAQRSREAFGTALTCGDARAKGIPFVCASRRNSLIRMKFPIFPSRPRRGVPRCRGVRGTGTQGRAYEGVPFHFLGTLYRPALGKRLPRAGPLRRGPMR